MNLEKGMLKTSTDEDTFEISIETESDVSVDGGHTYEVIENSYYLSKEQAKKLIFELLEFIDF